MSDRHFWDSDGAFLDSDGAVPVTQPKWVARCGCGQKFYGSGFDTLDAKVDAAIKCLQHLLCECDCRHVRA